MQGGADPKPIVRLPPVFVSLLHKLPCGLSVHRQEGFMFKGQTLGLQITHQSIRGFLEAEIVHRNQGIEEVKTNGCDLLHHDP